MQPNPFPSVTPRQGTDRSTFMLRFEHVSGIRFADYTATISGPCGNFTRGYFAENEGEVVTIELPPTRFGSPGRWCTGRYTVRVTVEDDDGRDVLFGATSFRVR